MTSRDDYRLHLDVRYEGLEKFDVHAIDAEVTDEWWNQSLVRVNDCVLRLGIVKGEFHWHRHEDEDEVFYVVSGTLLLDLEDETHELTPGQGMMVPRGVLHRTRAPEKVVMLMTEGAAVDPEGTA